MQDILTCAMGLDVHRDIIVACLAKGELGTCPEIEIRSFSTLVPEMKKLRDWGLEAGCHHIAMESTGIYWQPIYERFTIGRCIGLPRPTNGWAVSPALCRWPGSLSKESRFSEANPTIGTVGPGSGSSDLSGIGPGQELRKTRQTGRSANQYPP